MCPYIRVQYLKFSFSEWIRPPAFDPRHLIKLQPFLQSLVFFIIHLLYVCEFPQFQALPSYLGLNYYRKVKIWRSSPK